MDELTLKYYLELFFNSPFYFITLCLFSAVTAFITYQLFKYRLRYLFRLKDKIGIEKNKRDAFKLLLDRHADIIVGKHIEPEKDNWITLYSEMSKDILLWGSDKVIAEYGKYVVLKNKIKKERAQKKDVPINYDQEELENHFANAVLAFRKEVGYRNLFKKVKPEYILLIFKSGNNVDL